VHCWQSTLQTAREEAEDLVQEALLKAFQHLQQFRGESRMGAWLGVIVLNAGREWVGKRKSGFFSRWSISVTRMTIRSCSVFPILVAIPSRVASTARWKNILLSEIDELNSLCKSAIRLCALDGLSHVDAANALGVNVITIKSRIFHGKRMLKQRVGLRTGVRNELSQSMELLL
jgi:RNA polymerase sigma-70 factor (ECF subfamily)